MQTVRLDGTLRTEAESLSFENMTEERFQECYHALINAAMKHLFVANDESKYNQLMGFF